LCAGPAGVGSAAAQSARAAGARGLTTSASPSVTGKIALPGDFCGPSKLNTLIRTTLDSVKGFAEACEDDTHTQHSRFFDEMSRERSQVASQLQAQVRALGGDPEDDSSFTAAAHRGFMNLKQAVMGNDDEAIIEEVERGEDYLKAKYEAALEDDELSPETRQVIQQAYQSVRKGHDTASEMKHQMQG
jgi:uncharacterized protein (TIGR02284 family)